MDYQTAQNLFGRALRQGAKRISLTTCEWRLCGNCEQPRVVSHWTRPAPIIGVNKPVGTIPLGIDLIVRCRQCPACERARSLIWSSRAEAEINHTVGRTWFVTLTVRPEHRSLAGSKARVLAREEGVDFDRIGRKRQFGYISRCMGEWLTLYLKRLRRRYAKDEPDVKFRYLCVFEPHKDGFPHIHLLVHEYEGVIPARKFAIWRYGFVKARLVENGSKVARYVAKYCAKTINARVRASTQYGQPVWARLSAIVRTKKNPQRENKMIKTCKRRPSNDDTHRGKSQRDDYSQHQRPAPTEKVQQNKLHEKELDYVSTILERISYIQSLSSSTRSVGSVEATNHSPSKRQFSTTGERQFQARIIEDGQEFEWCNYTARSSPRVGLCGRAAPGRQIGIDRACPVRSLAGRE